MRAEGWTELEARVEAALAEARRLVEEARGAQHAARQRAARLTLRATFYPKSTKFYLLSEPASTESCPFYQVR